MKYDTRHFGEIEVDDSLVIMFNEGIPGFAHCKKFVLIYNEKNEEERKENGEKRDLFCWLQSLDDTEIAFALMDVFVVMPDYNPLIDEQEIAGLGEYDPETFVVYNIAVIPEDLEKISVNLKAPIVINTEKRLGRQVIANNDSYAIKFLIFEELKKRG